MPTPTFSRRRSGDRSVEDEVRAYSAYLPHIYTGSHDPDQPADVGALNLSHCRLLRIRARPKILLAQSYEDAWSLYTRYSRNILGVISDVAFPRNGALAEDAGLQLAARSAASMRICRSCFSRPIAAMRQGERGRRGVPVEELADPFRRPQKLHSQSFWIWRLHLQAARRHPDRARQGLEGAAGLTGVRSRAVRRLPRKPKPLFGVVEGAHRVRACIPAATAQSVEFASSAALRST
jgi:hypothetical protein